LYRPLCCGLFKLRVIDRRVVYNLVEPDDGLRLTVVQIPHRDWNPNTIDRPIFFTVLASQEPARWVACFGANQQPRFDIEIPPLGIAGPRSL
jgi:hypothetical protein